MDRAIDIWLFASVSGPVTNDPLSMTLAFDEWPLLGLAIGETEDPPTILAPVDIWTRTVEQRRP